MTHSQILILLSFGALVIGLAKRFPRFALTRPVALLMSIVGLGLGGLVAFWFLPVELMPNNSFGVITITTPVRGGMSPTEVERQITKPIEESISSVAHLRNVISNSTNGKSVVSLEFEPGTDMDFATLDTREKFSRIKGDLPREVESPIIAHYRESDVPVHIFALTSSVKSSEELRTLVDRELKEKLLRVKGVAHVDIAGGRERKIIIDVDRNRLAAQGMDIRRLVQELEEANLNVKSGELSSGSLDTSIRTTGQFITVDEIANTVIGVTRQGTSIHVKDVALVKDSFLEQESLARLNSNAAVTIYVQKESDANTVQVVHNTKKILSSFQKTLPDDISVVEISNQADAILAAIGSVRESLLVGIFLIVIILGLFLGIRFALIVAISIPLAALMTGALMYLQKLSVNVMTLSGLTLGIGLLVDNSIVVLEIIVRHVSPHETGKVLSGAIENATSKVTSAIVGGTLTSIVVFIPFFILSKQLQILYSGMAITITASLLASLYIALTTVPYLMFRVQSKTETSIHKFHALDWKKYLPDVPALLEKLQEKYTQALPWAIEHKRATFLTSILLFLGSLYVFQFHIDKDFSPSEESNEIVVYVELPSGKRLEVSDKIVKQVEDTIRAHQPTQSSVRSITTRIEGWSSKVHVALMPPEKRKLSAQEIIESLRDVLKDIGATDEAFIYFSSAKSGQELTINIYGEEEKITADYAMQLAGLFEHEAGFTDTKIRYRPGRPEVSVTIDPSRAALLGLDPTEIGNILHAQTRGLRATYFRQAGEEVETIVRLQLEQRDSIDTLKTLLVPSKNGRQIPLEQFATFKYSLAPSEIWRNNRQRMIQVSSNISKMSLEKAAEKAQRLISQIPFNTDYWAEIGGDYQDRLKAQQDFRNAVILTSLLIFAVLACLFESVVQPLLLFVSVPMSAVGIVLALLLTRTPVTMGVMIGILMTGGIVVNHAILYLDHFNERWFSRKGNGSARDLSNDLLEAGRNRLRPILMTKLTTVLGLLPMAMDRSNGAELWRPMAITTIGGILSSMVLTLFVLPCLIYAVELMRFRRRLPKVSSVVQQSVLVSSFLFFFLSVMPGRAETPLPIWVNKVVDTRVNDLLAQAKQSERKKDYDKAIELGLEAVRLSPQNVKARETLLHSNAKALKLKEKELEKKRGKFVAKAYDKHRATAAWREATQGKIKEAERDIRHGRLVNACDRYYQILEESPSYLPALKGLETAQEQLTKELQHGGKFPTEDSRQVAQGFWFYNQKSWSQASQTWAPVLSDPISVKKWGSVRLGAYFAKANQNHEEEMRQKKIDQGLEVGLAQFRNGNLKAAEEAFQNVLVIDPSNTQAKEYARLIPGLKERVRADVLTEVSERQMAQTLSDALQFYLKGFYDEAEAKVQLVLKESPEHPQALRMADDIQKARGLNPLPTLEEKKTEDELQIEKLYSDGIIAFAEGRPEDAKKSWKEVLAKNPKHGRAQQALRKLQEDKESFNAPK